MEAQNHIIDLNDIRGSNVNLENDAISSLFFFRRSVKYIYVYSISMSLSAETRASEVERR